MEVDALNLRAAFSGTCNNCGKVGHKAENCWSKGKGKGKNSEKGAKGKVKGKQKGKNEKGGKPTCSNCGKVGHKAENCW
eukprot:15473655-Alexandrium_andersonii.AAC.1